jgi:GrpB-like predicted nucleotidyltransferase (UPF0157 family)
VASPDEITRHHDTPTDDSIWVHGRPEPAPIRVVEYDAAWPASFERVAAMVRAALGERALAVEHVGSTAVPGLAAKPVIDVDLTVADPAAEAAYVPDLEAAGFELVIREPAWHEHRALKHHDPDTNLHVFGPDCPETIRHRMFRDWLREHLDDLARYHAAKLAAAADTTEASGIVTDYNRHKEPVIRDIYDRMFHHHGLH